ncbi:MAG: hypothetical protein EOR57_31305 [Mesorhizobium sp.]|uniref:hypothetical protein n=1 Tax=Mesorhizobium sp. TaxID=1871066 RepID=UPI000FE6F491|nr:hypothetical protein [Mesorhizobium sp.]RWL14834.1 MAG: hypothetical protein EOR57_31305 [Mesorhizobium sp.]
MTTNETPAPPAIEAEAVAWRVLAEPNLPVHFARTKADADHLVNNLLTYRKGCTSARAEPLFASPPKPQTEGVVEALREALRFYADKKNWMAGRWPEDPDELVEDLICIDWQHEEGGSIPFADCGDRARKALRAARLSSGRTE